MKNIKYTLTREETPRGCRVSFMTYDTKEMARLIDYIVEVATPDELARMKQEWR